MNDEELIPVGCIPPALYRNGGLCPGSRGSLYRGVCVWGRLCSGALYPGTNPPRPLSPCEKNDWHTLVKTLPCPKLYLRVLTTTQVADTGFSWVWRCQPPNLLFLKFLPKTTWKLKNLYLKGGPHLGSDDYLLHATSVSSHAMNISPFCINQVTRH